jgi:hypothetical protein
MKRKGKAILDELRDSRKTYVLIVFLGGCLLLLAVTSFFRKPAYENGVWIALLCFSNALSGVLSFMYGITIPRTSDEVRLTGMVAPGASTPAASPGGAVNVKCPKCGNTFDAASQLGPP